MQEKNKVFPLFRKPPFLQQLLPGVLPGLGRVRGRAGSCPTAGQSCGGPIGRPPTQHEERGGGHNANIIRKGKDEEQTEQPSLALNKHSEM